MELNKFIKNNNNLYEANFCQLRRRWRAGEMGILSKITKKQIPGKTPLTKNILLIGILFLILPNISALIISEIMYAPNFNENYNEWIEMYNNGTDDLDLMNYTLCEKDLSGGYVSYPSTQLQNDQGLILQAGKYAIITDGGSGTEVYSNFNVNANAVSLHVNSASLCGGLVNSGKTISLKDSSGNLINSVSYNSNLAYNNDKSLQICSSSWIEENPTPGSVNSCAGEVNNNINNATNNNDEEPTNESLSPTIEVNYSSKADLNQEFIFKIKLINFDQDIYDIKIDILSNGARIANIMNNNQWKSTTYYLNDIIKPNEEKEFIMMITKEFENADIMIKIKNSNDKIETFQGYKISRLNNEEFNGTASDIIYLNASLTNPQNSQNEDNKINISNINSDSKDIKSEENIKKLDKNNYAKYTLTAFIFLLALLFLLKKIFKKKYQNEFKN